MQLSSGAQRSPGLAGPVSYRPDIDGLRALAVTSVVIYHAFPSVLRGGFVGVDVFFVISGFLISGLIFEGLEKDVFSFAQFYARRVRRIFPALLLVLLACLAGGWFLLLAEEYKALGKHVAAGAAFVSNLVLWSEAGYFDAAAQSKPLLHLWSLGIEEQFYLCWPLLTWLAYRRHKNFLLLTLFVALASFAINVATVSHNQVAAFYSPLARVWELMLGAILAYLSMHRPELLDKFPNLKSWFGILCIGGACLLLEQGDKFPGWWALLPALGTFLVISSSPAAWLNRWLLSNRAVVAVGLISYPLYLWHWPALFVTSLISVPSRTPRVIAVAFSLALAAITYVSVEKPIRHSKALFRWACGLTVAMGVVATLGLICYFSMGLPSRLPAQISAFSEPLQATPTDCLLINTLKLPSACTESRFRPTIFVWGDSHANSLAAGLDMLVKHGVVGKLQITGSSCPPLLGFDARGNSRCAEINQYALDEIARRKPDLVILHSLWASDAYDLNNLPATLKKMNEAGAGQIVVLGPVPRWNGSLLRSVFRCWSPRSRDEPFPLYSKCGLDPSTRGVDQKLRSLVEESGVRATYVSALDLMCGDDGCLTHLPGESGKEQLETYDYGHVSVAAAEYLMVQITNKFLPKREQVQ